LIVNKLSTQLAEKVKMFKLAGESPLSQGFPLLKTVHKTVFNSPLVRALLRHCAYGAGEFRRLRAATKGLLALWTSNGTKFRHQREAALDQPLSGGVAALKKFGYY